jgi:Zn-finger nucleic acid-binding protein
MRQARKHRRMEVEVNERTRRSCPACERPMVVLLVGEVEVDECRNCGGIWLDDKELESLARLTSLPNNLLNRYPTQEHPTRHLPGERPCPACRDEAKLVGVPYLDVPVEMCKKCFGFWLEHGRLGKVLRAKRSPMQLLKGHRSEWRCPYCQSVAGAGRDVCDKCGAPRPSTGFTGKLG